MSIELQITSDRMARKAGVTLVEVMLSIVIISILAVTMGSYLVKTRTKTRLAEVRLQTILMADTVMQEFAVPHEKSETLPDKHRQNLDGSMHFTSEIVYTVKTEKSVVDVDNVKYEFQYVHMKCTTTSDEYPTISIVHETIVRKKI